MYFVKSLQTDSLSVSFRSLFKARSTLYQHKRTPDPTFFLFFLLNGLLNLVKESNLIPAGESRFPTQFYFFFLFLSTRESWKIGFRAELC